MNIPSHYQSALFSALRQRSDVDLVVRYFHGVSVDRKEEGWQGSCQLEPFEQCVEGISSAGEMIGTIPDGRERIHIIGSQFNPQLVDYFCEQALLWCHWSEMPGIRLAGLLHYHMGWYRILNPLMLMLKYREGRRLDQHALHVFGQGILAKRSFRMMGVAENKISDLYYTPAPLPVQAPCEQVVRFSAGRKVFLAVGALCQRKGIDLLLKAFSSLATKNWCLVLCGLDKSAGLYEKSVKESGLENQVLFLGPYPVERISAVYCASNVFVLASRFDGWGAVLNEAASLGMPLIGTDMCSASWHVIVEGVNGFRVKADSVPALKTAMQAYVDSEDLIESHGAESRKIYFREFTPEKNAERLVTALHAQAGEDDFQ